MTSNGFRLMLVLLLSLAMAFSLPALAANPGHIAAAIGPGTFEGNGNYNFPISSNVSVLGYLGIGTTSLTQKLTVNGSTNVSGTVYANNFSSNSPLQLQTGGTTRIFVDDTTGYVGIGTTSPISSLNILGGLTINGIAMRGTRNSRIASSNSANIVDSTGDVGRDSSITIGSDGFPIISYSNSSNSYLKVAHCGNSDCSSGNTVTTVDSIGSYTSIAIGSDGLPVISYYNATGSDLKVAHCGNAACSANNTITNVDTNAAGSYSSITIGSNGFPIISYYFVGGGDIKVVACGNLFCNASNSASSPETTNNIGQYSSIAIGSDGFPVISYYDVTNANLRVAHCGDSDCSTGNTFSNVDTTGNVGQYTSITIGTDGLPIISYYDATNGDVKVAHCGNLGCDTGNVNYTLDNSANDIGNWTAITIGTDGLPIISYYDATNGDVKAAHCGSIDCSSGNSTVVVDTDGGQYGTSIAIGSDGLPIMSYRGITGADLVVAKCGSENCIPYWTRR